MPVHGHKHAGTAALMAGVLLAVTPDPVAVGDTYTITGGGVPAGWVQVWVHDEVATTVFGQQWIGEDGVMPSIPWHAYTVGLKTVDLHQLAQEPDSTLSDLGIIATTTFDVI